MEATQNGVSGHSVKTRAGDPQLTEPGTAATLSPLPMGSHVLEIHSKRSWNVPYHAQVSKKCFVNFYSVEHLKLFLLASNDSDIQY